MPRSLRRVLLALACLSGPLALPSYAQFPHCAGPSPDVEPNDTPATASALNRSPQVPWTVVPSNGAIDPAGDVDHFRIDLSAGQRLWVLADTAVTAIGSRDSFVQVIAPDGSVLAENDNDGTAFLDGTVVSQDVGAIAALAAPATGTYVIRVSAANPADRMSYRLYTAVTSTAGEAEIEPNDSTPVQPMGLSENIVRGELSPGDTDVYWGGVLGNGPRMVLVQGDVDVALPTDPVLGFFSFPSVTVDSSGLGGVEALMLPEGGTPVRVTAPPALPGPRPYLFGLFYIGDACNLPVSLQSFGVE